ncbi:MAG TPA: hypothetical protein VFN08_08975 [Gemmatimonadales bacterium]|jgi:hypothetical protein|nr:hypothetical protein [Gemmatimonadales bacterium]
MTAKPTLLTLGLYLLAMTAAGSTPKASWFEARTTGARMITMRGTAQFGDGAPDAAQAPFVISLGAESSAGAVIFTRPGGGRLEPGTYPLEVEGPHSVQALVVTGSPTHPTGAFHARTGVLTITRSRNDLIEGHFDVDAVGFEASDLADEGKQLVVRGAFTALPGR